MGTSTADSRQCDIMPACLQSVVQLHAVLDDIYPRASTSKSVPPHVPIIAALVP